MFPTPNDPTPDDHDRRALMRTALALGVAGLAGVAGRVLATDAGLIATPANALGPFYPPQKPADSDADLTVVNGHSGHAKGTVLYVSGRVLDLQGRPQNGAELELWQANAFGRYHHPSDSDASGPLDPDFQGYGRLLTDTEGRYRIKTIKPPPYSGRTPHVHFNVAAAGVRLTTQLFFEGEARNERDALFRYLSKDDRRASTGHFADRTPAMEADAVVVVWDVVLRV